MKKACIILRGIHYDTSYCNNNIPKYIGIDFRKMIDNFFDNVYIPLSNEHNIDIITSTYTSKLYDDLLKTFKPKHTIILPFTKFRNRLIYNALELLSDLYNDDVNNFYDFILIYRFDIHLKQPITTFNYNLAKINIPFKDLQKKKGEWNRHRRICDAFFIFNGNMLNVMLNTFRDKYDHPKTHQFTYDLICKKSPNSVNFLIDDEIPSNSDVCDNILFKNRL